MILTRFFRDSAVVLWQGVVMWRMQKKWDVSMCPVLQSTLRTYRYVEGRYSLYVWGDIFSRTTPFQEFWKCNEKRRTNQRESGRLTSAEGNFGERKFGGRSTSTTLRRPVRNWNCSPISKFHNIFRQKTISTNFVVRCACLPHSSLQFRGPREHTDGCESKGTSGYS